MVNDKRSTCLTRDERQEARGEGVGRSAAASRLSVWLGDDSLDSSDASDTLLEKKVSYLRYLHIPKKIGAKITFSVVARTSGSVLSSSN